MYCTLVFTEQVLYLYPLSSMLGFCYLNIYLQQNVSEAGVMHLAEFALSGVPCFAFRLDNDIFSIFQ